MGENTGIHACLFVHTELKHDCLTEQHEDKLGNKDYDSHHSALVKEYTYQVQVSFAVSLRSQSSNKIIESDINRLAHHVNI